MYCDLRIQEYFVGGLCNKNLSKLIFKAQSKCLDITTQQKWKFADGIYIGCKIEVESGKEILIYDIIYNENRPYAIPITYDWFHRKSMCDRYSDIWKITG